jgi:hypothetical protein
MPRPFARRPLAARERKNQPTPIGIAAGRQINRDFWMLERDVGDLDAPDQQREEAQPRGHALGRQRGMCGIAKSHVGKAHGPSREQAHARWPAQNGIEAGDVTDFIQRLPPNTVGRHQQFRTGQQGTGQPANGQ